MDQLTVEVSEATSVCSGTRACQSVQFALLDSLTVGNQPVGSELIAPVAHVYVEVPLIVGIVDAH